MGVGPSRRRRRHRPVHPRRAGDGGRRHAARGREDRAGAVQRSRDGRDQARRRGVRAGPGGGPRPRRAGAHAGGFMTPDRFAALWRSLAPIGRDASSGGYLRYSWSAADLAAREWFVEEALDRDLDVETDGNGNLWAWWGTPDRDAVVTGSHLDSVPHGGAYDGPLGVVSGLLAIDLLRERAVTPRRPIGVVVFTEEEGARFGVPCLGSRLLTGAQDPARALELRDRDGIRLADAMTAADHDPARVGPDPGLLSRIGAFVELHVEQ